MPHRNTPSKPATPDHIRGVTVQQITITCADGQQLAATQYESMSEPQAAVMVAPATAILRRYYRDFATWLASRGYVVVTFDNRGLGGSLTGHVRDSTATLTDWGALDMPAVADYLHTTTGGLPVHVVGHSAGGQLLGLMPNHSLVRSLFTFGSCSGSVRKMAPAVRWQAEIFFRAFLPANTALLGYANTGMVGMGEPLPAGVADQWAACCRRTGYLLHELGSSITRHWFGAVSCPAMMTNSTDDLICTDRTITDLLRLYPNMPVERTTFDPAEHDLRGIGHMKFFHRDSSALWSHVTDWLDKNIDRSTDGKNTDHTTERVVDLAGLERELATKPATTTTHAR